MKKFSTMSTLFTLAGVPCLVATVTMLAFGLYRRGRAIAPVAVLGH